MALASGAPGDHIKGAASLAPGSFVHMPMQIWALAGEIKDALSSFPNTTHFHLCPKAAQLVSRVSQSLSLNLSLPLVPSTPHILQATLIPTQNQTKIPPPSPRARGNISRTVSSRFIHSQITFIHTRTLK